MSFVDALYEIDVCGCNLYRKRYLWLMISTKLMSVVVISMKKISMADDLYKIDVCGCNYYEKDISG
jgi:hypothetical protein